MEHQRQPVSFIATDDPDEALRFYTEVLGLEVVESSPYALVLRDHGQTLRVQIVSDFEPPPYTAHGWEVSNIAGEIDGLAANGVAMQHFEHMPQDERGIWTTPDGNKIAWFTDPSGNTLSLTEFSAEPPG